MKNLCFDLHLVYDKAYAFREFNMVDEIKIRENNSQQSRIRPWFLERTTDIGLFHFTDDQAEAVETIKTHREKQQAMENE